MPLLYAVVVFGAVTSAALARMIASVSSVVHGSVGSAVYLGVEVRVVGEVEQAAAHGQQILDGDHVAVGDVVDVHRDRVAERHQSLIDQAQHGVGGERLGHAPDPVVQVRESSGCPPCRPSRTP